MRRSTRPRIGSGVGAGRSGFPPPIAEHGGELIDQGHTAVRQLAQELGLQARQPASGATDGTEDFFWVNDGKYTYAQLVVDLNGIYQKLHRDVVAAATPRTGTSIRSEAGSSTTCRSSLARRDGSERRRESNLGRVLDIAYNIEYGAECSVQSSLNLLYLLGYSGQGQFRVFGESNEKYHVRGGNDQVPHG